MKKFLRLKHKLYRKYFGDIWGVILKRGKINRTLKFLLYLYRRNIYKKVFSYRTSLKKFIKTSKLIRIKKFLNKKTQTPINFIPKLYHKSKYTTKKHLLMWKKDFWIKFNSLYIFNDKNLLKKKKNSFKFYLRVLKRTIKNTYLKLKRVFTLYSNHKKSDDWRKKNYTVKKYIRENTPKLAILSHVSWLECARIYKRKRLKSWWYMRIAERRTAIFFCIFNLKKLRYILNLSQRPMVLSTLYFIKLETMINVVLFRLNLFNSVKISTNFIKISGLWVNGNKVIYPYRFIKINDIFWIDKKNFKKLFNMFCKNMRYGKNFLLKKVMLQKRLSITSYLASTKVILNYPRYFTTNYKILHFIMWRLPNKKELSGFYKYPGHHDLSDWSMSTQVAYN